MNNQIALVTPPDDILGDGLRILAVDLDSQQSKILSDAFKELLNIPSVILYVWNTGNDIEWLLDKKHKSDAIIFNGSSENELIVGYLAAQPNSYYIGTLKSLDKANTNVIFDLAQMTLILDKLIERYEQRL